MSCEWADSSIDVVNEIHKFDLQFNLTFDLLIARKEQLFNICHAFVCGGLKNTN